MLAYLHFIPQLPLLLITPRLSLGAHTRLADRGDRPHHHVALPRRGRRLRRDPGLRSAASFEGSSGQPAGGGLPGWKDGPGAKLDMHIRICVWMDGWIYLWNDKQASVNPTRVNTHAHTHARRHTHTYARARAHTHTHRVNPIRICLWMDGWIHL